MDMKIESRLEIMQGWCAMYDMRCKNNVEYTGIYITADKSRWAVDPLPHGRTDLIGDAMPGIVFVNERALGHWMDIQYLIFEVAVKLCDDSAKAEGREISETEHWRWLATWHATSWEEWNKDHGTDIESVSG